MTNRGKLRITCAILFLALIIVMIKERYPQRVMSKFTEKEDIITSRSYLETFEYQHEMDLYKIYKKKGNVVMLGNSITYRVDWNELLNRDDIINRGIGRDITVGFLGRLKWVLEVEPRICFIMGGINDLENKVGTQSIIENLKSIASKLESEGVIPIIYSVIYVGADYQDHEEMNKKIEQINSAIRSYCQDNSFQFIDLNPSLAPKGILKKEYSLDGVHLTGKGYSKWREIILPVINENLKQ